MSADSGRGAARVSRDEERHRTEPDYQIEALADAVKDLKRAVEEQGLRVPIIEPPKEPAKLSWRGIVATLGAALIMFLAGFVVNAKTNDALILQHLGQIDRRLDNLENRTLYRPAP